MTDRAKCESCKKVYELVRDNQPTCNTVECMTKFAEKLLKKNAAEAKLERADLKQRKDALKSVSDWCNEFQVIFNIFIVLRDHDKPCPSCGAEVSKRWNAGHYMNKSEWPSLRFNELNVHKQCARPCNDGKKGKSGNLIMYRRGLVGRIGLSNIDKLETSQKKLKLTIDQIKALMAHYREKNKILKKRITEVKNQLGEFHYED